jgi:hypothetical protein
MLPILCKTNVEEQREKLEVCSNIFVSAPLAGACGQGFHPGI